MNVEILSISKLRELIAKTDYLIPNIHDNDREPSWDGNIEVYSVPGDNHKKSDLKCRVPVQVKGHCEEKHPDKISYSVELSDLRNYLNAGGTIFFVIYVDKIGEKYSIYYSELLPYTIKLMLNKVADQKTTTIYLNRFPTNKEGITNILFNFASDMEKQYAAIQADLIPLDQSMKEGKIKELSFSYTDIAMNQSRPFDYMFSNRLFLYETIDRGIKLPVSLIDKIVLTSSVHNAPVCVKEKQFFNHYTVVDTQNDTVLKIGAGITFSINEEKKKKSISLVPTGTITERIIDLEFMIEAIHNGNFSIKGIVIGLSPEIQDKQLAYEIEERIKQLDNLKKIQHVLNLLHVNTELDLSCLYKQSQLNLNMLIDAIVGNKEVPLIDKDSVTGIISIGNINIFVCTLKQESGLFLIKNLYGRNLISVMVMDNGQEVVAPLGIALKREVMQRIDNMDYDEIVEELNFFEKSPELCGGTVIFLLEIIHAYDSETVPERRQKLRNGAFKILEWIKENDSERVPEIHILNELQIIKRERELNEEEQNTLIEIIENASSEDIKTGAYLLLGNQRSAKRHFDMMTPDSREIFSTYPIFYFWKNEEDK